MMDIASLARPEILAMQPYASARSSMPDGGVLLNANEAPWSLVDEPGLAALELNRYPSPQPAALKERFADLYGVDAKGLLITRGSDEGIDLLTRVFCRPGQDAIAQCTPCFGMYNIAATIQGAAVVSIPRDARQDLRVDIDALCGAIRGDGRIRLVFLTSPNNPTGDSLSCSEIVRVIEACAERALLILDEAYIEFSGDASAVELLGRYPQLVVLRTLSKAWAAAGLRCGTVIADPQLIDLLQRIMAPYPVSTLVVDAALKLTAPGPAARQQALIDSVRKTKTELLAFLEQQAWIEKTWPGDANFVLLRVPDATGLVAWCEQHNIRIRSFHGQAQLDNCVRLSIGSEAEVRALSNALREYGASR